MNAMRAQHARPSALARIVGGMAVLLLALGLTTGVSDAKRKSKTASRNDQQTVILRAVTARNVRDQATRNPEAEAQQEVADAFVAMRARDTQIKANIVTMQQNDTILSQANKRVGEAEVAQTKATIELQKSAEVLRDANNELNRLRATTNVATNANAPVPTVGTPSQIANQVRVVDARRTRLVAALAAYRDAKTEYQDALAIAEGNEAAANQQLAIQNRALRLQQLQITHGLIGTVTNAEFQQLDQMTQVGGVYGPAPAVMANYGQSSFANMD